MADLVRWLGRALSSSGGWRRASFPRPVVEEAGYGRLETPGVGGVGVWGCGWFRDGRQGDLLNHRRRGAASVFVRWSRRPATAVSRPRGWVSWRCGWFRDGRQGDLLNRRRRGAASSTTDVAVRPSQPPTSRASCSTTAGRWRSPPPRG